MNPFVLSVNVAKPRQNPDIRAQSSVTGIDKRPVLEPVEVRAPNDAAGTGSGLVGDTIGNPKLHGGADQAVYVYAREDLDAWEARLGRALPNGVFGENVTTVGIDVTNVRIGERWQMGTGSLVLEASAPRTPCRTFSSFLGLNHWIKTFTAAGAPGAYFRVLSPGPLCAGDTVTVEHRPDHDVTVGMAFHARTTAPELIPALLEADALSENLKDFARRRLS
jgi:MOSC domain-containing protein YiiM